MAVLSVVTAKFVAVGLEKELAGHYNTAYGYLQIFGILADFGLYAVSMREVSRVTKEKRAELLGAFLVLRIGIMTISLGMALLFAWIIPQWYGTPLPLAISIAALVPGFTLLAGVIRTVFQIEYKLQYVFIAEVTQRILTVLLTGTVIALGVRSSEDVRFLYAFLGFGGIGAAALFFLSIVFSRKLMRVRPNTDRALLRHLFRLSLPYGLCFLCTTVSRQMDVTLIGLLRPDFEIQNAEYGFVQRVMDMAYLLPSFLLNSAMPLLSERDAKGEDTRGLVGGMLLGVLLLGITSALFSAIWARPIMQLLTADDYLSTAGNPGSDTALQMLSISMLFGCLGSFSFYLLLAKHRWQPLIATLLCGVVLSLSLNFLWIPELGYMGAARTSAILHAFIGIVLLPIALRGLPPRLPLGSILRSAAFCALLALYLLLMRPVLSSPLPTMVAGAGSMLWMGFSAWATGLNRVIRRG